MEFTELLQEHNVPYKESGEHHHVSEGWVGIDCPDCSPDSGKFRLGWNLARKYFSCWVCGKKDTLQIFVLSLDLSWDEARGVLEEIEAPRGILCDSRPMRRLVPPLNVGPLLSCHRRYLEKRGFNPKMIGDIWGVKGIGVSPAQPMFQWSLYIPIIKEGKIVSYWCRKISDNGTRYRGAKEEDSLMSKGEVLYGEDYCSHTIVICEGPTDVWRIGKGAVATGGLDVTATQINLMARHPRRVICFDSEPDAQRKARRLAEQLSVLPGETLNVVLDAKDPGSASQKEIRRLRTAFLG